MAIPIRIFLAEDDNDDCLFFTDAMEELQIEADVVRVKNGSEFIDLLQSSKNALPDIVFIDLNMPCKNGLQCLTEIKQDVDTANIPVVIMSTSSDAEIVNNLYEHGASLYICKPADFNKLKNNIMQAIAIVKHAALSE